MTIEWRVYVCYCSEEEGQDLHFIRSSEKPPSSRCSQCKRYLDEETEYYDCKNCGARPHEHVDGWCLFSPTKFRPDWHEDFLKYWDKATSR